MPGDNVNSRDAGALRPPSHEHAGTDRLVSHDAEPESKASPHSTLAKIFISYRREDTLEFARKFYEALTKQLDPGSVYMDISSTPAGSDFRRVLKASLVSCSVLIPVIGPKWLTLENDRGTRRIDEKDDYVRLEIETALNRGVAVMPLLVNGAEHPAAEELPRSIRELAYLQSDSVALESFHEDVDRFYKGLEADLAAAEQIESEIARRSYDFKILDLFKVNLKKFDRRFITTVKTLILKPSQIRHLHLPYFLRPLEFLSACVILEVLAKVLLPAFFIGDIRGVFNAAVIKDYFMTLAPLLILMPIESLLPAFAYRRDVTRVRFKTRIRYYCYVAGWIELTSILRTVLPFLLYSLFRLGLISPIYSFDDRSYWLDMVLIVAIYISQIRVTIAIFGLSWVRLFFVFIILLFMALIFGIAGALFIAGLR